jgi:Tol biopolymer transport system component
MANYREVYNPPHFMPLTPGTRVGSYEVVSLLGAGGMGEVYRARDTRLQRDVAIKVLPDAVAGDSERLARFEREARTLAALNHPNIAHVHGFEERALVMELVDGEDLAAAIARGPIPIDEALHVARQIASALDAAHAAGIIHRDLKPANIKVRPDGTVKVLDFGLARSGGPGGSGRSGGGILADSPTITSPAAMTSAGMILGTAAYMSPEQARGREVDKRTDIWAFGCVLYEMLSGRPAFDGDTVTDVLSSIVKSEPDWTKLPIDTPPGVRRLLRRCLEKDLAKRRRDIGDAIVELDTDVTETRTAVAAPAARRTKRQRARLVLAWAASLVIIGAAAAASTYYFLRPAATAGVQKFQLAVQPDGGTIREPVISPDGRRVAYVGRSRILVQELDQWQPRELAGTEAASRPFWSPDSNWIGYTRAESLLKVPASGGPVVRIATLPAVQAPAPLGATSAAWADDGTITVSLATGPLLQVPGAGGTATPLGDVLPDGVDLHDVRPLPGGAILATVHRATGIDAIGVVKNGSLRIVLEASGVFRPSYATSGHLIYERRTPNAALWAVPFSLNTLAAGGEPFLIEEGTEPTVARDGTLIFLAQRQDIARQLAWFTFDGKIGARVAEPREWTEGIAVSPDGRRVLASTVEGIWAYDVDTGARSRITTGSTDITPRWIDSNRIVFVRNDGRQPVLILKQLSGSVEERELARRARFPHATADGRRIVFNIQAEDQDRAPWQIAWIDLADPATVHRLAGSHLGARFPSVSADGTLVAYVSGEVGLDEIFLTRLPSGEGKYQVSTGGGGWTRMSARGDAVLYRAPDGAFMSVPVAVAGGNLKIGQPQKLFDWGGSWTPYYDLASDGKHGIAAVPADKTTEVPSLSVVQNWHLQFSEAR